jgi:hypothetical protein
MNFQMSNCSRRIVPSSTSARRDTAAQAVVFDLGPTGLKWIAEAGEEGGAGRASMTANQSVTSFARLIRTIPASTEGQGAFHRLGRHRQISFPDFETSARGCSATFRIFFDGKS